MSNDPMSTPESTPDPKEVDSDDIRLRLVRALWADMMDPPGRDWLDDEEKAQALAIGDRLMPVVTAYAEEYAASKVAEAESQ